MEEDVKNVDRVQAILAKYEFVAKKYSIGSMDRKDLRSMLASQEFCELAKLAEPADRFSLLALFQELEDFFDTEQQALRLFMLPSKSVINCTARVVSADYLWLNPGAKDVLGYVQSLKFEDSERIEVLKLDCCGLTDIDMEVALKSVQHLERNHVIKESGLMVNMSKNRFGVSKVKGLEEVYGKMGVSLRKLLLMDCIRFVNICENPLASINHRNLFCKLQSERELFLKLIWIPEKYIEGKIWANMLEVEDTKDPLVDQIVLEHAVHSAFGSCWACSSCLTSSLSTYSFTPAQSRFEIK